MWELVLYGRLPPSVKTYRFAFFFSSDAHLRYPYTTTSHLSVEGVSRVLTIHFLSYSLTSSNHSKNFVTRRKNDI
jgi:hypothetical protein